MAVFRSHFGASSDAPFAHVDVLEFGKSEPIFSQGLSAFAGNEATVQEMKSQLLKETAQNLKDLNIDFAVQKTDVDALVSNFDNQILIEADTRRTDRSLTRINIRFEETQMSSCPNGKGLQSTLTHINSVETRDLTSEASCWEKYWRFSKGFVVGQYFWLSLISVVEPMPDLFFGGLRFLPFKNP